MMMYLALKNVFLSASDIEDDDVFSFEARVYFSVRYCR